MPRPAEWKTALSRSRANKLIPIPTNMRSSCSRIVDMLMTAMSRWCDFREAAARVQP